MSIFSFENAFYLVGWLVVLEFNATLTAKVISVGDARVSWLSHTSTNTAFLSKATDYFLSIWTNQKLCRLVKSLNENITDGVHEMK